MLKDIIFGYFALANRELSLDPEDYSDIIDSLEEAIDLYSVEEAINCLVEK